MNSHQRRKFKRTGKLVRDWSGLAMLPESQTHRLKIDVDGGNGWIVDKSAPNKMGRYLSTHTFYGGTHIRSTHLLRQCGFQVTCANWDEPNKAGQASGKL